MLAPESFSTAEVAEALGVSVSTVKRWVDEGILRASRTAGGHRRLRGEDVVEAVRSRRLPQRDLSALGRPTRVPSTGTLIRQFVRGLHQGDPRTVRQLLHGAHQGGMSFATLADQVIAPGMAEVGHGWESGRLEVYEEHRATQVCQGALYGLKLQLLSALPEGRRPLAVGAAPSGDPYVIANLLAELVLLEGGWNVMNFGPDTPMNSLCRSIESHLPHLVWLSVSYVPEFTAFQRASANVARAARRARAFLVAGGRAWTDERRMKCSFLTFGDNLQDLATRAYTLRAPIVSSRLRSR